MKKQQRRGKAKGHKITFYMTAQRRLPLELWREMVMTTAHSTLDAMLRDGAVEPPMGMDKVAALAELSKMFPDPGSTGYVKMTRLPP